jgi:hypothetical protein
MHHESDSDMAMVEYTMAGDGRRLGLFVYQTDAELEYAYDRKSHVGTLAMADDLTVINLKKGHIEVREVTFNHDSWPQGTSKEWDTAPRGEPATGLMTDWLKKGKLKGLNPPPKEQK